MSGPHKEDERLLLRAKIVAIGVVLALMSVVTLSVVLTEPEASLVVVIFPALSGVLLALFGVRAFVNRNGDSS
jgi:uncharacterized membrane protein YkgB